MKSLPTFLILGLAAACGGDDGAIADAPPGDSQTELDAAGFPAAPALGAQIDRMGRPAVNTVLNSLFDADAMRKRAKRDAYNQAADPATWLMTSLDPTAFPQPTVLTEFAAYLAGLDSLDAGHAGITPNGCGNSVGYSSTANPLPTAYHGLATVLADDQLYVDTSRSQCDRYLALELNALASIPYTSCGGRTLTHDVVDASYSLLLAGAAGFNMATGYAPRIGDGVSAHTDVNDMMFPFLGAPH